MRIRRGADPWTQQWTPEHPVPQLAGPLYLECDETEAATLLSALKLIRNARNPNHGKCVVCGKGTQAIVLFVCRQCCFPPQD
jgi:hypothetical protein